MALCWSLNFGYPTSVEADTEIQFRSSTLQEEEYN